MLKSPDLPESTLPSKAFAPNPRLQRTRMCAPLSRKPLGGMWPKIRRRLGLAQLIAVAVLTSSCTDTSNFLTIAVPADVLSFQVAQESGAVLWQIESAVPRKIERIHYGQVPSGFRQVAPVPPAAPRLLKDGEQLVTVTIEPSRTFKHHGNAVGSAGFLGGVWESSPKERPTAEASRG